MKNNLLFFVLMLFCMHTSYSQVGIGTVSPNVSSMLDISATNKGVSFPNVALSSETDATTITTPMTGLMVYNTSTSMPCGGGLYFNNGTPAAPIWSCFTKTTKQLHSYSTGATSQTATGLTVVTGTPITVIIPTGQVADIKIDGILGVLTNSGGTGATVDLIIYNNGAALARGGWNRNSMTPNSINVTTVSTALLGVTAGTYVFDLRSVRSAGTSGINYGGDCLTFTNCGELNLIVTYK